LGFTISIIVLYGYILENISLDERE